MKNKELKNFLKNKKCVSTIENYVIAYCGTTFCGSCEHVLKESISDTAQHLFFMYKKKFPNATEENFSNVVWSIFWENSEEIFLQYLATRQEVYRKRLHSNE